MEVETKDFIDARLNWLSKRGLETDMRYPTREELAAFADGWQARRAEVAAHGWISVEDRLPERNGPDVLVLGIQFRELSERCAWSASPGGFIDPTWAKTYSITHWMPLPTPPVNNGESSKT